MGGNAPVIWEGSAIIPKGTFDLVFSETEDPIWKWQAQVNYGDEVLFKSRSSALNSIFFQDFESASERIFLDRFEDAKSYIQHIVIPRLDREFGLKFWHQENRLEHLTDFKDLIDPNVEEWGWTLYANDDDYYPVTSILIYVSLTEEPVMIMDSEKASQRYVYSINVLSDSDDYIQVVRNFLVEIGHIPQV
jgi:hypothetical protein